MLIRKNIYGIHSSRSDRVKVREEAGEEEAAREESKTMTDCSLAECLSEWVSNHSAAKN